MTSIDIPLSIHYKGKIIVYKANNEADKEIMRELARNKDYDGLRKFVIQESEWVG